MQATTCGSVYISSGLLIIPMIFQNARNAVGSNSAAARSCAKVTRSEMAGCGAGGWSVEDRMPKHCQTCGIDNGLILIERQDMIGDQFVERLRLRAPVVTVLVNGIEQIRSA